MRVARPDTRPPGASKRPTRRWIVVGVALAALAALVVIWWVTPLAHALDPSTLARHRDAIRALPLAPLFVIVGFVLCAFVAAPATLMIGAATLLFGSTRGSLYAFVGMLANGSVMFWVARRAARDRVDGWLAAHAGSRFERFTRQCARRGMIAVLLMRLTPLPYTLQNIVAGASGIRFRDFVVGTAIGILPVILIVAGVAAEFDAWLADPDWTRLALLLGAVLVGAAAIGGLTRWSARR